MPSFSPFELNNLDNKVSSFASEDLKEHGGSIVEQGQNMDLEVISYIQKDAREMVHLFKLTDTNTKMF